MRRTIALALALSIALAVLALAGCSYFATTGGTTGSSTGGTTGGTTGGAASKTASVEIKEFSFQPSSVEVAVGGTVKWTNGDAVTHTVKGDGWASGDLAQGATFENTFATAGTFPYSCGVHPSMTGEVVVK
jgi:plastocyanin